MAIKQKSISLMTNFRKLDFSPSEVFNKCKDMNGEKKILEIFCNLLYSAEQHWLSHSGYWPPSWSGTSVPTGLCESSSRSLERLSNHPMWTLFKPLVLFPRHSQFIASRIILTCFVGDSLRWWACCLLLYTSVCLCHLPEHTSQKDPDQVCFSQLWSDISPCRGRVQNNHLRVPVTATVLLKPPFLLNEHRQGKYQADLQK